MALFGKKKEEEEEVEEIDEKEGRKITKGLKDLNPENKRKRKEPPKPWGKKERLIVLTVFVSTVIIAAVLMFTARGTPEFGQINITLPSFESLNILKEETIIIEKPR